MFFHVIQWFGHQPPEKPQPALVDHGPSSPAGTETGIQVRPDA
jgi:hypothetical protein